MGFCFNIFFLALAPVSFELGINLDKASLVLLLANM